MTAPSRAIADPGPRWWRRLTLAAATVYLASIWLDAARTGVPDRVLPRPVRFFTQVACLFPYAAQNAIEFRAAAFGCDERRFSELDVRPFFPIHADDKENRFDRAMFFYHRHRPT